MTRHTDTPLLLLLRLPSRWRRKPTDTRGFCFWQLSERSYRVVDSKEGSVFVQVSHGSRDREFANVYMSGSEGRAYTLSLRTVVKDYRGLSDFERINGVCRARDLCMLWCVVRSNFSRGVGELLA